MVDTKTADQTASGDLALLHTIENSKLVTGCNKPTSDLINWSADVIEIGRTDAARTVKSSGYHLEYCIREGQALAASGRHRGRLQ